MDDRFHQRRRVSSRRAPARGLALLAATALFPLTQRAGSAAALPDSTPDKSAYTLFNPVPRELMRPLAADRPDTTESPFTVDAGHLQIESSLISWTREGDDDAIVFASTNLKVGLLHHVDLQFVLDPYLRADSSGGGWDDGFGDAQVRVKINLWGNDRGPTALALMPFIKVPAASGALGNGEFEGGLIVPFAMDLAPGVGLGLMAELDAAFDEADGDHDLLFVHTAVLGLDLTDRWGAFTEYVGEVSSDPGIPYVASAGLGLTYAVTDDCQLDAGVNIGLNDAADDVSPFIGFTLRF